MKAKFIMGLFSFCAFFCCISSRLDAANNVSGLIVVSCTRGASDRITLGHSTLSARLDIDITSDGGIDTQFVGTIEATVTKQSTSNKLLRIYQIESIPSALAASRFVAVKIGGTGDEEPGNAQAYTAIQIRANVENTSTTTYNHRTPTQITRAGGGAEVYSSLTAPDGGSTYANQTIHLSFYAATETNSSTSAGHYVGNFMLALDTL